MELKQLRCPALVWFGLPLMAGLSSAHAADNVTLYGRVDLGVQYSSKTGTSNNKLWELYNGGILPSIWGLKGTESLGGDLSAFFNLESHFAADTGVMARAGQIFRRQANVGLKGNWGSVTLGRQYSPALLAHLGTEPRGFKEQFSGLYPYALNQNGNNPTNDLGIFIGNAVSYSYSGGPAYAGLAYSFGEVAGSFRAGQTVSLGGSYSGPVVLSASYQKINDVTTSSDGTRHAGVGAALPLGAFTVKAMVMRAEQKTLGVTVSKVETLSGGVDWAWAGNQKATLAVYRNKDKANATDKTTSLVLSNDYSLSKRTTLYAQMAYAKADPGATARTTIIAGGSFPGAKTTVFGAGIMHSF